ncbi:hypothetical protein [Actinoplanes xinjiangensis]|uniref:hypothetical protein n=1 Tax=Actinoplanes xinjiangensis TaxID=512350 RepID=UPI003438557A
MGVAAGLVAACALVVPAADPPPGMAALLLTTADLPAGYQVVTADENPYQADLFEVIGRGAPCRLPAELSYSSFTWQRSVSVTFLREDENDSDDQTLTEVVADRGAETAGALVDAAVAMPRRCPAIDTPRREIAMSPITMPTIGDRSAALRVHVGTKSGGASEGAHEDYYDSWSNASIAVVAIGSRSVVVVLMGTYESHDVDLTAITRRAVARLGQSAGR